ncbi:MAG: hypothetical protein AABZ47_11520 [Planctomycetota bacterium]
MNTERKISQKHILSLLGGILAATFAGCSGQPAATAGEKLIRDKIQDQAEGRIKLVSFRKTNGQTREAFGMQEYVMEWEGEIEFLQDCRWGPFVYGTYTWSGDFHTDISTSRIGFGGRLDDARMGQKVRLTGSLTFRKTEKGWRGEDGRIY